MCSLYLGENLISGNKPINLGVRNIGEVFPALLPVTDAGAHLLDGSLILGGGIYQEFVDYVAELYNDTKVYNPSAFTVVGNPTITDDGIASGFSNSNYIKIPYEWAKNVTNFKITGKFKVENSVQDNNSILGYSTNNYSMGLSFNSTTINWFAIKTSSEDVNLSQRYSITPNIDYSYELQLNNNLYTFRLFDDTGSAVVNLSKSTNSPFSITSSYLRLGVSGNYSPLNAIAGSIDLKSTSITVDGKEVFSGSKPAKYFTDETTWQQSITDYGSCGKFVYDSTNNTVRLPKVSDILQGTTDVTALGDLVEAGLPNITGQIFASSAAGGGMFAGDNVTASGALALADNTRQRNTGSLAGSAIQPSAFNIDASRSSSVYGNSNTVQPQTIKVLYYIVIANSTKTEIQSDIDKIATDLNNKADTDLTNVTDTGYIKMAGAGMPSNRYIDLTLGATGSTYTAPASGWFQFAWIGAGASCQFYNNSAGSFWETKSGDTQACSIQAKKGDTILQYYTMGSASMRWFRFYYAQGSESEAQ